MIKFKPRWLLGIAGVIFIFIGGFCFMNPLYTYVNLVRFSGIALLMVGIVLQISSAYAHTSFRIEKRSLLIESIIDYTFGILLIFNPFLTFIAYPFIIGFWILFVGIIKIIISLLVRRYIRGWMFILFFGILACIFSLLIIYKPLQRSSEITQIIGAFCITMGSVLIFDSFRLKRMHAVVDLLF